MDRSQHKYETKIEKGKPFWDENKYRRIKINTISFYIDGELKDSYEEVVEANYTLIWSDRLQTNIKEYLE